MAENGAKAGRERTDPICYVLKKTALFPSASAVCFRTRLFQFLRGNFLKCLLRRFGAMCFASGSIFGNKFLTPVGIKTLFPIFENSLCGKELAEKTQTLNATNKDIYFMSKQFNSSFFQIVERRTPDEFFAWQFSGLRVWWVGNLPFVSSKRLQIPTLLFSRPFCNS